MVEPASATTATDEDAMGRIATLARFENNLDFEKALSGEIPGESIRRVEVPDALVDPGATSVCLPLSLIRTLGLLPLRRARARTAEGVRDVMIDSSVRVTIQDRDCAVDVMEPPEGAPILIGQGPLEPLDLVPFPGERKLPPNPAPDGEWTLEID